MIKLMSLKSRKLNRPVTLSIYIPEEHDPKTRMDLLIFHDGQNLFYQEFSSYGMIWQMKEALRNRPDTLCVGIHSEPDPIRSMEYSPLPGSSKKFDIGQPRGEAHAAFVAEELLPYLDQNYRLSGQRVVAGSSLGAVISFYTATRYPGAFSGLLLMSSAHWLFGNSFYRLTEQLKGQRIYLDVGTCESAEEGFDRYYLEASKKFYDRLKENNEVFYVIQEGARHNEIYWASRLPKALEYLWPVKQERGMMAYQARQEIPEKYTWDFSSLYQKEEDFQTELKSFDQEIKNVASYKGRLTESKETLEEAFKAFTASERMLSNLYSYASQHRDLDTRDPKWQDYTMQLEAMIARYQEAMSYVTPEILANDENTLRSMISGDLEEYRQQLENILRAKNHTLSAEEEALIASFSEVMQSPSSTYALLNNADLIFPEIEVKGQKIRLTSGNFIPYMMNPDRELRKTVMEAFYSVYKAHKNTLASLISGEVKSHIAYARAKHFESARAASLFQNNIPESVYDALIEAVHEALPAMYKYLEIRKKSLGLDELHMYDVYAPLVKEADTKLSFDEARTLVEKALLPMGEDYAATIRKAFDERWIDVYETPGKRSGAYSGGSYDSVPYVLLNHQDTLDSAFTLAHELGHSMHTFMSKGQGPVNAGYPIFLAEIASTFNEALLNHYLIENESDKAKKKAIINNYLDAFKGTIFRQTMFAEFERDIHKAVENGESLTSDKLCKMYHDLNQLYFGPDMHVDEELDYEWSRIPHFYYNFYVFQYATGMSAATAFAKRVIEGQEGALEKYKGFLRAGSSKYALDVLKDAGLDMTDPSVIVEALKTFSDLVDEFEAVQ